MHPILEVLSELPAKTGMSQWKHGEWKLYVATGDRKHLRTLLSKRVLFGRFSLPPPELIEAIGRPSAVAEEGSRLIEALLAVGYDFGVGCWLGVACYPPGGDPAEFTPALELLRRLECDEVQIAALVARGTPVLKSDLEHLSEPGRFLASLSSARLGQLFDRLSEYGEIVHPLGGFLARHAPDALREVIPSLANAKVELDEDFWVAVLAQDHAGFADLAVRAVAGLKTDAARFRLLATLAEKDPAQHQPAAEKLAVALLFAKDSHSGWSLRCEARDAAIWLITTRASASATAVAQYLAAPLATETWRRQHQTEYKNEVLDAAARHWGPECIPLFRACFETDQGEVQLHALQLWILLAGSEDPDPLAAHFRNALAATEPGVLSRMVRAAGDWQPERLEEELWRLLSHKSRPVREATAAVLAKLGDSRLPRASALWQAKRADTRMAVVSWLRLLGTPAALAELEAQLDVEEDEDVRDALLLAIERLSGGGARTAPSEQARRIRRTVARLKEPPVAWLVPEKLPAARFNDGRQVDAVTLCYWLYRQSRVKEIRADLEAKPLYTALDRSTSGELGLAVLQAFLNTRMDAGDKWVLAFAALVGDDRLVPLLVRQIRVWADAKRGKLAEYAVQALALLGTDAALLAVDAMAIRYRSKNKNIGKAATDAFADAARERGLTPEELGDRVVPWLGFEPGQPRVVDTGKLRIEVRIGIDLKFAFRDAATRKPVAKLPDHAPPGLKSEFKELAASLKEAAKSQGLRLETLMVRQFRWTTPRWSELYLQHPLLFPFAQRLVWGLYGTAGGLETTFRALDDRTLTTAADEPWPLPGTGTVGIVHPLELPPAQRQAWLQHLADYDIHSPFPQLERTVVTVKPEEHTLKFGRAVAGTELNGLTFRGRAERLGWTRGSVCDAGGIGYYLKSFPAAGVDCFLELDGMFIGIDMYTDIKLGQAFFVKSGSVKIGGYEYDEPHQASDPRLVAFGEVPPIAFSEAMGDLARIAARTTHPD